MNRRELLSVIGSASILAFTGQTQQIGRASLKFAADTTAFPFVATAAASEQTKRIAMVNRSGPVERLYAANNPHFFRPFFDSLRDQGYVEGQNLTVLRYSGEGNREGLAQVARSVIDANPDAIFVTTGQLALAFKDATTKIPVIAVTADPISVGLTSSLAHPGRNITGVVVDAGIDNEAKRVELLLQLVPAARTVAYLTTRTAWESSGLEPVKASAAPLNVAIVPALIEPPFQEQDFRRTFDRIVQQNVSALVIGNGQENYPQQQSIIELARTNRLPAIYPEKSFADLGGLISYGPDFAELYRQAADYIARILHGSAPGDLPFYRPTRLQLVINLKTAKALGLTVPQSLFARADEVIE